MGTFSVRKEYSFDSAHRLVNGYKGKCAHLHGHTWKVRFACISGTLDEFGFVRDFSDFKPMKDWIDEHLDHATIVAANDGEVIAFLKKTKQKMYVCPTNPTSENLCKILYCQAHILGLPVSVVEIDETCTSNARFWEFKPGQLL